MTASPELMNMTEKTTTRLNFSEQARTVAEHTPPRDGCLRVVFSEMEYLPWNNSDNIISAEVEAIVSRIYDHLLVFMFLIGVPANVINMAVFFKQGLSDRVNLCLFVLSLTDGMFLTMVMLIKIERLPAMFTTEATFGPFEVFMTNHNGIALFSFSFVSPVLSAIIATERCLCVYNPMKFQRLLRTRTMASIIMAVYVTVFSLFFIVVFRYRLGCIYDPETGLVRTTFVKGKFYKAHGDFIEILDSVTFGTSLPATVLVVVITTTVLTILKLRQAVSWRAGTSSSSSSISPREVALTKMLVGNSILFIVFFSPDAINHLSRLYVPGMTSGGRYHNFFLSGLWIGDMFIFFNSTLNIFVYYSMGSRYRETLWALFGRKARPPAKTGAPSGESVGLN